MPISSSNNRSDTPHSATRRVAIVGTGFVGSTSAYALLMSGTVAEIVLIDRDREVALSLPAVINREGVARVLPISLNPSELKALQISAEILREHIAKIDGSKVEDAQFVGGSQQE